MIAAELPSLIGTCSGAAQLEYNIPRQLSNSHSAAAPKQNP
jgi:hypothetical protein